MIGIQERAALAAAELAATVDFGRDVEEALKEAWLAGYVVGLNEMYEVGKEALERVTSA